MPVLVMLGVMLSATCDARAGTGWKILETIGISTAAGTVLGASTLPFYSDPGEHFVNVAIGAAAGLAVGIGILTYGLFEGSPDAEAEKAAAAARGPQKLRRAGYLARSDAPGWRNISPSSYPAPAAWLPLVSYNW